MTEHLAHLYPEDIAQLRKCLPKIKTIQKAIGIEADNVGWFGCVDCRWFMM